MFKFTYSVKVENERFDPTAHATAHLVVGKDIVDIQVDDVYEFAHLRLWIGRRMLVNSFEEKWRFLGSQQWQRPLIAFAYFCSRASDFGFRNASMIPKWQKLSGTAQRQQCRKFGHVWHYDETGDAENGPGPIVGYCLRCLDVDGDKEVEDHDIGSPEPRAAGFVEHDDGDESNEDERQRLESLFANEFEDV